MKAASDISSSEENEDEDIMNSSQNITGSPCSATLKLESCLKDLKTTHNPKTHPVQGTY